MADPADDARLLDLAAAVTDDLDVDWAALEQSLDSDLDRSLVRELRMIAAVASTARQGDPWPEHSSAQGAAGSDRQGTWGRLRLEEVLGKGSFGTVYKAWDPVLEQHVALKLLHPRAGTSAGDSQRALDEARMLARVSHDNVVRVFGVESHEGRVGLWMELVKGRTLEELLQVQGPLGADEARQVGAAVCRGLSAVHKAGLVHQDLKAHNVMREEGGRIVLMDFGEGLRSSSRSDTWLAGAAGTPLYLAPEIFAGRSSSEASDIYSVGVLLFHLVTGSYPVEGGNRLEIERAHQEGRRSRLRDARPDLPPEFVQMVERALAANAGERFQTAGDFEAALNSRTSPKHAPRLWVVGAGALLSASIGLALLVWTPLGDSAPGATISSALEPAGSSSADSPPAPARDAPAMGAPYRVRAMFYRRGATGDEPLGAGSRLALKDTIALNVDASTSVYVYVLNQDDRGEAHLLYPLVTDLASVRPLPAGRTRIPPAGVSDGWVVNSPGQREHFLVAVSPHRLTDFEQEVSSLPRPRVDAPIGTQRLPERAIGTLRGVGGLAPAPAPTGAPLAPFLGATPLNDAEETAAGPWLRRITFENP